MTKRRKPRVAVVYRCSGCWDVWIDAPDYNNTMKSVILSNYKTRDSANAYAKRLRAVLRS